jgi:hypothetical protein
MDPLFRFTVLEESKAVPIMWWDVACYASLQIIVVLIVTTEVRCVVDIKSGASAHANGSPCASTRLP